MWCICLERDGTNHGENIGGEIQPPDDSEIYLNVASMRHVFWEFKTVVSTDNTLQIQKKNQIHILTYSFMGLAAEQEDRAVTRIVQNDT